MDKELLHKYFAGETTEKEEKLLMDWAESTPENYQTYLKERKWWNALLVNSDLLTESRKIRHKKSVNFWMLTTAAAAIALIFILFQRFPDMVQPEGNWQTVWVPAGQRAQIILNDSTVVWLNSRSTLTYPASFASDKRIVKLDGEGYFDVKNDPNHPFIVQTSKYDVEVLGTSFNVLAYDDYELFETSLLSGSVKINSSTRDIPAITLKPNEKVYGTIEQLEVRAIENPDHFRWKEGLICLDDERFEDLTKKFSLYFDVRIMIQNSDLLDYRCTGKFRQSDGVDYALKVLQTEMKFNYTRNNELNEIIIK